MTRVFPQSVSGNIVWDSQRPSESLTENRPVWKMAAMNSAKLRGRRALAFAADSLPQRCPNCGQQLEVSSASFLLVGRTGDKSIFNDDGRFCPGCDVVILNADYIREVARLGLPTARKFVVGGFVDLGAVPEDKKNTLLGQKDNPIPFVKFASFDWRDRKSSSE